MKEEFSNIGYFTAFREDYGFAYFYRETAEDLFKHIGIWGVTLSYAVLAIAVTVIIMFLGTRGYSRWRMLMQMVISLAIGCGIILCARGLAWKIGGYKRMEGNDEVHYTINVGLLQSNLTMCRYQNRSTNNVQEYHNLKIGWYELDQAEKEYRAARSAGWPPVLLRFARYLSADMGEILYMRGFRISGYACSILLWAAFAVWVYANVLFNTNISSAALTLLLCGSMLLTAVIVYDQEQPDNFSIPLDKDLDGKPELLLRYDWMFWVVTFLGVFTVIISLVILTLDYLRPEDMNKFFGTEAEITAPEGSTLPEGYKNRDLKVLIRNFSLKNRRAQGSETSSELSTRSNSNAGHASRERSKVQSRMIRRESHDSALSAVSGTQIELQTHERTIPTPSAPTTPVQSPGVDNLAFGMYAINVDHKMSGGEYDEGASVESSTNKSSSAQPALGRETENSEDGRKSPLAPKSSGAFECTTDDV